MLAYPGLQWVVGGASIGFHLAANSEEIEEPEPEPELNQRNKKLRKKDQEAEWELQFQGLKFFFSALLFAQQ